MFNDIKRASWVFCLLFLVSTGWAADHAIVLQYHNFSSETPRITSVSLDEFIAHLDLLQELGAVVWPLETIIDSLQAGASLPDRCTAITVDDAYGNFLTGAWPILQQRDLPATLFVPTASIDSGHHGYLTWDQLRLLRDQGVALASHGHNHIHMADRPEGQDESTWLQHMREDIERSLLRMESELGSRPRLFAYPYGEFTTQVRNLVGEMDLIGFGQQSGAMQLSGEPTALPRFPASGDYADTATLRDKLHSLPLPVIEAYPGETVTTLEQPTLRLQLVPGNYRLETLAAYVSGQGRTTIDWVDREKLIFEVTSEYPLANGRNRYNITMASQENGRYMWYSFPWLKK